MVQGQVLQELPRKLKRLTENQIHPYLPRRLDSLDHGEANHRPGDEQAHGHLPVESSTLRDVVGDVQGLAVPVVGGGRALLTFWHHICGHSVTAQPCRAPLH